MRILVASKFWYRRGGLERVMFDEIGWLEAAGHEVAHFSTQHPSNEPSPWSGYFAPYLELGSGESLSVGEKVTAAGRMFWNGVAKARFGALLEDFRPDIVHVHGIHRQLSPSILFEAKSRGVPVVQSLHDYHHVCPADTLLRGGTQPCSPPACGRYWYGPAVTNRCVRQSVAASTLSAAETAFQRFRGAYEQTIDRFISPSEFLRDMMSSRGWSIPCSLVPNGIRLPEIESRDSGAAMADRFVLFAGRVVQDKGVDVFLEAAVRAGVKPLVAGDGPLRAGLEERYPAARFLGHVETKELERLMKAVACCVVPSRCLENAPMSVLEPMALARPVVASRIGGIPEIIEEGVSGLLVSPDDVGGLSDAIHALVESPERATSLGAAARARVQAHFSAGRHLESLVVAYEEAMGGR